VTAVPWAYRYRARLVRLVDADTARFEVDMGLRITHELVVRLKGCNAAEKTTPSGQHAITYATRWYAQNADPDGWLVLETAKDPGDKFGRWLATVRDVAGGRDLTADLIAAGFAVAWDGRGSKPVPADPAAA
jgi:endonuclease YncB( thermonuclease family)